MMTPVIMVRRQYLELDMSADEAASAPASASATGEATEAKNEPPKQKRDQTNRGQARVEKQKLARQLKRQVEFTAAGGVGNCPKYARLAAVIEATGTVVKNINTGVDLIKEGQAAIIEGQKLLPQ